MLTVGTAEMFLKYEGHTEFIQIDLLLSFQLMKILYLFRVKLFMECV